MSEEEKPTHLDLFSGIGGFALAAQWAGFRTVAFCEIDKFCQKVLSKNFGAILADASSQRRQQIARSTHGDEAKDEGRGKEINHLSDSGSESGCPRIYSDIFDLDGTKFRGCSLITGGFPCQPFSVAGKRRGKEDDRNLWPEMLRVISEARPAWVVGENVAGIVNMELDNVLSDLEGIGYSARPIVIPACAVDAKHRRNRVWIVANCASAGLERTTRESLQGRSGGLTNGCSNVADPEEGRIRCGKASWKDRQPALSRERVSYSNGEPTRRFTISRQECREWLPEPDVGRVAHGIPSRVDRLRGLGNSIVPQVAYEILKEIRRLI